MTLAADLAIARMLEPLTRQMHAEMLANTFKGERWAGSTLPDLEHELLYHVVKLLHAARALAGTAPCDLAGAMPVVAVREYAADVANCAGILADQLGAWTGQPVHAQGNQDQGYVPEGRELLRQEADAMIRAFDGGGTPMAGEPPAATDGPRGDPRWLARIADLLARDGY